MDEAQVDDLMLYLTRSKVIWTNPELLNLVESEPSPTKAFTLVLRSTGSQKKAKAARWYACAIRDFGKDSLGAFASVLRSPQGAEKLERLLLTTSPRQVGPVKEKLTMANDKGTEKTEEVSHVIDCDADPLVPQNWQVLEHQKGGLVRWSDLSISLYLDRGEQKQNERIQSYLRRALKDQKVLNANVLDFLLEHPELIPV